VFSVLSKEVSHQNSALLRPNNTKINLGTMEEKLTTDKKEKLELAVEMIASYCAAHIRDDDPPLPSELQRIHQAVNVEKSDKLVGRSLSGSSNYTYKVHLKKDEGNTAVFVKVALNYALWNPDAVFALDRISNEKKCYDFFRDRFFEGDDKDFREDPPICMPYFLADLSPSARMLVSRWEHGQTTWNHQFRNGVIDQRLPAKVARLLATINLLDLKKYEEEFPTHYNEGIKPAYRTVCGVFKAAFAQMIASNNAATPTNKHFLEYARQVGQEVFDASVDRSLIEYEQPDVLLHGDFGSANLLVEEMIGSGDDVIFGPRAALHKCDWDMSHVGTLGRDIGPFHAFPIACAYFLAAQGKLDKAKNCIDALWAFFDEYCALMAASSPMAKETSIQAYKAKLVRSCLGWNGIYQLGAHVILKAQLNEFPLDMVPKASCEAVMASYSLTGLKSMEWGFLAKDRNPEFTVEELRAWFRDLIESQIDLLSSICV
jgi:hypothetical protein